MPSATGSSIPARSLPERVPAAPDPAAGSSLARRMANVDTDDHAADFLVLAEPTPGSETVVVPEPARGALLTLGLVALAQRGRRRSGARAIPQRDRTISPAAAPSPIP